MKSKPDLLLVLALILGLGVAISSYANNRVDALEVLAESSARINTSQAVNP